MNEKLQRCLRAIVALAWITQSAWATSHLEASDVVVTQSRAGKLVFRIQARKVLRQEDGSCVFPEGGHIEMYDQNQTAVLMGHALWASYSPKEGICKFKRDVEIKTIEDRKQLNTELLFWDVEKRIFYTEKFVRIETEGRSLTGEGLTADQDLEHYTLECPQGVLEHMPEDDPLAEIPQT